MIKELFKKIYKNIVLTPKFVPIWYRTNQKDFLIIDVNEKRIIYPSKSDKRIQ